MKFIFYRLDCLTNLHLGSGDANYDVIDLQVERDPVLGEPTMNASGVKGALRDHCEIALGCQNDPDTNADIKMIFGTRKGGTQQGSYVFFNADLLARPVRVSGCDTAWLLATTPDLINSFVNKLCALGLKCPLVTHMPMEFKDDKVKTTPECGKVDKVEGYDTETIPVDSVLSKLLGTDRYAIMSHEMLSSISLPVQAHNVLKNGISKNLWYEEYVPHKSVFGLIIGVPGETDPFADIVKSGNVVQFGAEASTGCGYIRMTEVKFDE